MNTFHLILGNLKHIAELKGNIFYIYYIGYEYYNKHFVALFCNETLITLYLHHYLATAPLVVCNGATLCQFGIHFVCVANNHYLQSLLSDSKERMILMSHLCSPNYIFHICCIISYVFLVNFNT